MKRNRSDFDRKRENKSSNKRGKRDKIANQYINKDNICQTIKQEDLFGHPIRLTFQG